MSGQATVMPSGRVISVRVDAVSMSEALDRVLGWTDRTHPRTAVGINAFVCTAAARDATFQRLVDAADLCYADGQSVVWAGRILGIPLPERLATTDLIDPLAERCAAADKQMFFFGGRPGVAAEAAERLLERHPGLRIATSDGYVSESEMAALVERIATLGVDVLLVGLGDPLQQQWVARYRDELGVPAVLTCGGLFDWVSGRHRRAPAWMISAGLEWLWRLMIEPRRLAKRYVIGNTAFMVRLAAQLMARGRRR